MPLSGPSGDLNFSPKANAEGDLFLRRLSDTYFLTAVPEATDNLETESRKNNLYCD